MLYRRSPLIKQFQWIVEVAMKIPLPILNWVVPHLARLLALNKVYSSSSSCEITKLASVCTTKPLSIWMSKRQTSVQGPHRSLGNCRQRSFTPLTAVHFLLRRSLWLDLHRKVLSLLLQVRTRPREPLPTPSIIFSPILTS